MDYYACAIPDPTDESHISEQDWMTGVDVGSPGGYLVTPNRNTPAAAAMVSFGQVAWHTRKLNKVFDGKIVVYMNDEDPEEHSAYQVVISPL